MKHEFFCNDKMNFFFPRIQRFCEVRHILRRPGWLLQHRPIDWYHSHCFGSGPWGPPVRTFECSGHEWGPSSLRTHAGEWLCITYSQCVSPGRSPVRFPVVSLQIFIDITLLTALRPEGIATTVCWFLEIWKPQPSGAFRTCLGLYRDCFDLLLGITSGYAWRCWARRVRDLNPLSAGGLHQGISKWVLKSREHGEMLWLGFIYLFVRYASFIVEKHYHNGDRYLFRQFRDFWLWTGHYEVLVKRVRDDSHNRVE